MNTHKQYYTQLQPNKKYKDRKELILTTQQPKNPQNICRSIMDITEPEFCESNSFHL